MSLIDKVVFYLNDVLVSLDIEPIRNTGAKQKDKSNVSTKKSNTKA
jgi:hypothetical protein